MSQLDWTDVPIPDVRDIADECLTDSDERTVEGFKSGVKAGIEYAEQQLSRPRLKVVRDESEITMCRVDVALVLTGDGGDQAERVDVDFEGEPTVLQALGMLRMAEAQVLDEDGAS